MLTQCQHNLRPST